MIDICISCKQREICRLLDHTGTAIEVLEKAYKELREYAELSKYVDLTFKCSFYVEEPPMSVIGKVLL